MLPFFRKCLSKRAIIKKQSVLNLSPYSFGSQYRKDQVGLTVDSLNTSKVGIETAISSPYQFSSEYFLQRIKSYHEQQQALISENVYKEIVALLSKRKNISLMYDLIYSFDHMLNSKDAKRLQSRVIFYSICELIKSNQYQDGLILWTKMSKAFTTTQCTLLEILQTVSTHPTFIPHLGFLHKLHDIMKSNRWNESLPYYLTLLLYMQRFFQSVIDKTSVCEFRVGIELVNAVWKELEPIVQSQSESHNGVLTMQLYATYLSCQILIFKAQHKHRNLNIKENNESKSPSSDKIGDAFHQLLTIVSRSDYIDIGHLLFETASTNENISMKERMPRLKIFKTDLNANLRCDYTIVHAFNTLALYGDFETLLPLLHDFVQVIQIKIFRKTQSGFASNQNDDSIMLERLSIYFASIIRNVRFNVYLSMDDIVSKYGVSNNKATNSSCKSKSVLSSIVFPSNSGVLKAGHHLSSNQDSNSGSGSSDESKQPEFLFKKQNFVKLKTFALQLIQIMSNYQIPINSIFYASWISALLPDDTGLISSVLGKFSSYAAYYNAVKVVRSTFDITFSTTDLESGIDNNSDWKSVLREVDSIIATAANSPTTSSETSVDSELFEAKITLLCRFEQSEALAYAIKLVTEQMADVTKEKQIFISNSIYSDILRASLVCNSIQQHTKITAWVEKQLQNNSKYSIDLKCMQDEKILYPLFFGYAQSNHSFKAFEILETIRSLNFQTVRTMYVWLLSSFYYCQPTRKMEKFLIRNPDILSQKILRSMSLDGVQFNSKLLSYFLKLYGRAVIMAKSGREGAKSVHDTLESMMNLVKAVCKPANDLAADDSCYSDHTSSLMSNMKRVSVTDEIIRTLVTVYCHAGEPEKAITLLDHNSSSIPHLIDTKSSLYCYEPIIQHYTLFYDISVAEELLTTLTNQGFKPSESIINYFVLAHIRQNDSKSGLDFIVDVFNQYLVKPATDTVIRLLMCSLQNQDSHEADRLVTFIRNNYTGNDREKSVFIHRVPRNPIFLNVKPKGTEIEDKYFNKTPDIDTYHDGETYSLRDKRKSQSTTYSPTTDRATSLSFASDRDTTQVADTAAARKSLDSDESNLMVDFDHSPTQAPVYRNLNYTTSPGGESYISTMTASPLFSSYVREGNLQPLVGKPGVIYGALTDRELNKLFEQHGVRWELKS